MYSERISKKP